MQAYAEPSERRPRPTSRELADAIAIKRCSGSCHALWPADDITTDADGRELCPNDYSPTTTREFFASELDAAAAGALGHALMPNVSLARMPIPTEPVITGMRYANGNEVYNSAPLLLVRNVATILYLDGRDFSSSDTVTYPSGITDSVAPSRTSTTTTLTVIAALGMTTGKYNLTFNGNVVRGVFLVR